MQSTDAIRHARLTEAEVYSGALVDLLNPRIDDVHMLDVAVSLSRLARFIGHGRSFYSVAQHSVFVADLLPAADRVHGLLHDAAEAYIGDLANPVKRALVTACPAFAPAWKSIEKGLRARIYQRAGVMLPDPETEARVKEADLIALATEQRDVLASPNRWNLPVGPAGLAIRPVEPHAAFMMFADALHRVGIHVRPVDLRMESRP